MAKGPAKGAGRPPGGSSKAAKAKDSKKKPSAAGNGYASRSGYQYDRERVVEEIVAITAHYSGTEPAKQGYRRRFRCPECGKDTLDANTRELVSGCWTPECGVPQTVGAVDLIAYFEKLDPKSEFRLILEKGYEAAGLAPEPPASDPHDAGGCEPSGEAREGAAGQGATGDPGEAGERGAGREERLHDVAADGDDRTRGADDEEQLDLNDRVYRAILKMCKLEKHHHEFWVGRGLSPETIAAAGLGSTSKRRTRYILGQLKKRFPQEELLSVPGLFINDSGNLSFTLFDEYTLIPYYDAQGRVATIEGRILADKPPKNMGKYVSLRDSHNHVYLFPGTDPGEIVAFCEGPVGAIAAAQEGLAVGAIQGYRRYKGPRSGDPRRGGEEKPPPEIQGVDFDGRMIPYIPDVDDPPQPHIMDAAPEAARFLAALQNGRPALATLPNGKDLDQYLLAINKPARRSSLIHLLQRATPTASPPDAQDDDSEASGSEGRGSTEDGSGHGEPETGREGGPEKGAKVVSGPWPGSGQAGKGSASGTAEAGRRNGAGNHPPAERKEPDANLPHQARRVRARPDPAGADPYLWTGRESNRYRQPLPSTKPMLRSELLAGIYAGAATLIVLWITLALLHLAGLYLADPAPLPGFVPDGLAPGIRKFAAVAGEKVNVGLAALAALAVAALAGLTVISHLANYRKAKRRMLEGEIEW